MEITLKGIIEDVETYMGKNGFGCKVTLSNLVNKRRKNLTFITKDKGQADLFNDLLQQEVEVSLLLEQNNFGLRFGDILNIEVSNKMGVD